MKNALFVSLLTMATAIAAEHRNISEVGQKLEPAAARAMWDGIDGFDFPQASGVILIDNGSTLVRFITSVPISDVCIVAEITSPGNTAMRGSTMCIPSGMGGYFQMDLWNGKFPDAWPSGITRFRVLFNKNGNVTEVNAYVPVQTFYQTSFGPEITSITSPDGKHLVVTGQFKAPVFALNGFLIEAESITPSSATPFGAMGGTATLAPAFINQGNGNLTVCDFGTCSQTYFHVSTPSPSSLPVPGKG